MTGKNKDVPYFENLQSSSPSFGHMVGDEKFLCKT